MLRDRFSRPLDAAALALSESTREDLVLLPYDLWGSAAHARMLGSTGLIPPAAAKKLLAGLRAIGNDARAGRFRLDPQHEDVHLNVETELTRRLGDAGERLHTGRSRNDQVATDLLLYARDALLGIEADVLEVVHALRAVAAGPMGRRVVAGWTHLQPAQAVYVAQILGTHAQRFIRDARRLAEVREGLTLSPLGSGAIAGSSLPLDRRLTARLLGFSRPNPSSIDATSDRDALTETLFALALTHVHASQLAEELVIGAMPEVGRVRLADAFVTTSSLMPHKRNPDLAELVRAEAGPALGRLVSHLTVLKGLPLAYQRDLQVTKPILFDAVERAHRTLQVLAPMVATAEFLSPPPGPCASTASVELADALVREGVPFRVAHARVARFVAGIESRGGGLTKVDRSRLEEEFPELRGSDFTIPSISEEPGRRTTPGGSSWASVRKLLAEVGREAARRSAARRREVARLAAVRRSLGLPGAWFDGASRPIRSRRSPRSRAERPAA